MVAFDGGYHHGAEWDLKPGEERLTLITFFYELKACNPFFHICLGTRAWKF